MDGPIVTVNAGGAFVNNTPGTTANYLFSPLTLNGGTLTGSGGDNANIPTWSFAPTGPALVNVGGPATSYIAGTGAIQGLALDNSTTFSVTGSGGLIVSVPVVNYNGAAAEPLTKTGSGLLTLGAADTYSGATTISGGTLELGNVDAVINSAVADNVAGNGLIFATSGATYYTGGLSGSGSISLLAVGGGSLTLSVSGAGVTTYSGVLSGGGGLTNGGGGLVLINTSNYTGPTTISGGTLQLGNGAINGALLTSSVISDNGTLVLDNTGTVTQGTTYFNGAGISGTGGLVQAGVGTLVLNTTNSYSGPTTISAGTLQLANLNALENSTLTNNVPGGVTFSSSGVYNLGGLAGSGGISMAYAGSGGLTLRVGSNNAATVYSGALTGSGA